LFSSAGNVDNSRFVGVGFTNAMEPLVQQINGVTGHVTSMRCFVNGTSATAETYTLRDNATSTTATCTIAAGATTGSGGPYSVAITAGDLLDVATPSKWHPEAGGQLRSGVRPVVPAARTASASNFLAQ
jgi:hypothetical protein